MVILDEEYRQTLRQRGEVYFGGKLDGEGLVDFLLWRHEADRLGIELTTEDVSKLVYQDVHGRLDSRKLGEVEALARGHYRNLTNDDFMAALRDEFRVHTAKKVLLGYEPGSLRGGRETVTPYKFWQFYQDNLTESSITLLPVPVEDPEFLKKVKTPVGKEAFDKELKAFFKKHAGQEDNPASPVAGFKQPPRIQVEWVSARPDSPHYRREAERVLLAEAATQVATSGTLTGSLATLAAGTFTPAWLSELDTANWRQSEGGAWSESSFIYSINKKEKGRAGPKHRDVAPQAVAATVGEFLGAGGTHGSVLPVLATHESAALGHAAREAAGPLVECTAFLAGAVPMPFGSVGIWHYLDSSDQFLPPAAIRARLFARARYSVAEKLVDQKIKTLREEIELRGKLKTAEAGLQFTEAHRASTILNVFGAMTAAAATGGPPLPALVLPAAVVSHAADVDRLRLAGGFVCMGPSPLGVSVLQAGQEALPVHVIRQPIEQAIQGREFWHGATQQPHDRFTMWEKHNDPGLKPLWEAYLASPEGQLDADGRNFAKLFFEFPPASTPADYPVSIEPLERYAPKTLVSKGESFLYWSTAEEPAYQPTFDEVRDKVAKRWQLEKARQFAEAEAKRVAAQAKKSGDGVAVLRDVLIRHPKWGELIELDRVARLVSTPPSEMSQSGSGMQYQAYPRDPKDLKVEHPSKDFVKKLLDLKTKRDAVVVADAPESIYYVGVLTAERFAPSGTGFRSAYITTSDHQQLLQYLANDTKYRTEHEKAVLQKLKQAAHLDTDDVALAEIKPGD
jgi:hypothetical protein